LHWLFRIRFSGLCGFRRRPHQAEVQKDAEKANATSADASDSLCAMGKTAALGLYDLPIAVVASNINLMTAATVPRLIAMERVGDDVTPAGWRGRLLPKRIWRRQGFPLELPF
jgi:hypothetical protein